MSPAAETEMRKAAKTLPFYLLIPTLVLLPFFVIVPSWLNDPDIVSSLWTLMKIGFIFWVFRQLIRWGAWYRTH